MKYKMFTANGFHKDFQFWAQKGSLRGPRPLDTPGTRKSGLAWSGFIFFNFSFFLGNFNINWHCLVVPEMM